MSSKVPRHWPTRVSPGIMSIGFKPIFNNVIIVTTHDDPRRASLESRASEIFKLVSRGATDEQWAEWLRVPLEHAAADGNVDLVNALIEAGANGGAGWSGCGGRSLLESAAVGGNAEVVSSLLAAGSPPGVLGESGSSERSALYVAAVAGQEDAARRLLKAGANIHFRPPDDDMGILGHAVASHCEELVNDLLTAGANPNTTYGEFVANGWQKITPLHVTARYGLKGMTSALLASGADTNALGYRGQSPLMEAASNWGRSQQYFAAGTDSAHWLNLISAEADHLAVVNSLLAAGADVDTLDEDGYTALSTAAEFGHLDLLSVILQHAAADVNAASESTGLTALHTAAMGGKAGAIDALVEAGADIELKTIDGLTPLGCATQYSQRKAMCALLLHGANTDVQDDQGDTLLHLACREQDDCLDAVVDILLRSGADETVVNDDARTPLELLDLPPGESSQEEVERARVLLTRAPQDRIWRRRCWLVMLYSRASKARAASDDKVGCGELDTGANRGREDGGRSKAARVDHASGRASGVLGPTVDGCVVGAGIEGGGLRAVVESLIGLELEGVFRTVVGFL